MSNTWWKDPADLIPEQADLLDLPEAQSLLIKGPPGSGKTNLMLLRANQLFLGDRPNLHVVVFGSVLKQFIQIGGTQYKFPSEKIVTHAKLFLNILRENGINLDTTGLKLMAIRQDRAKAVENLILAGKVGKLYQALFLDEAQDYTSLEIEVFSRLTEVLMATADTRQRIFDVEDCVALLESKVSTVYPLKFHFRNGKVICKLADAILAGDPSYVPMAQSSQYDELAYPSKITPHGGLDLIAQAALMATQIGGQLIAYPDDLIGVLCPRNEDLDVVGEELAKAGLGSQITRANSDDFDPSRPIWLATISSAKGLEFRVLHIAGLEALKRMGSSQKRLIYTGVTRAKTALTLYWNESIPGYLDAAIKAVIPSSYTVTKKNIFGKV